MSCFHRGRASLAFLVFIAVAAEGLAQRPRETANIEGGIVRIEREGRLPVIIGGSDEILARDELVGTWQCTRYERAGESRPEVAASLLLTFSRGRLEIKQPGRPKIVMAYGIDIKRYPHGFHWVLPNSYYKQRGIYWAQDDRMWICIGAINKWGTNQFLTQPGDGRTLLVLERKRRNSQATSPADAEWMQLGSYVLSSLDKTGGSMLIRLAVNHQGSLIGQAYDLVTKTRQSLEGTVFGQSRRVRLWVGTDRTVEVETSLDSFSGQDSSVQVRLAKDLPSENWTMSYVFSPKMEDTALPTGP